MSQRSFPSEWTSQYTDPYAVLGVSVVADDRRVLKRYRDIAKLLHPDRYALDQTDDKDFATQLLARLVNPSYEQVKQEKGRKETSAKLRMKVRSLCREGPLSPKCEIARQLLEHPASGVDVFYEQAITKLAETQYQDFEQFAELTDQISELNLVYFQLKISETLFREKRSGLIAAQEAQPVQFTPPPPPEVTTESYDQRHYRRAQEYAKKGAWDKVKQELDDAIKIKPDKSEYHALLGVAYFFQERPGLAKVYLKQALKLDPKNGLAIKYGGRLGLAVSTSASPSSNEDKPSPTRKPSPRSPSSTNQKKTPSQRISSSYTTPAAPDNWLHSMMNWVRSLLNRPVSKVSPPRRP